MSEESDRKKKPVAQQNSWSEINTVLREKRHELKLSGKTFAERLENQSPIADHLPADAWKKLAGLNFLELSDSMRLLALSEEIRCLSSLTNLVVRGNQLEKLPESLSELKKLKYLDASHNQLSCLPAEIGACQELQVLNVANNRLQDLPDSIANCAHLTHVDVGQNSLEIFPKSLCNLQILGQLTLNHNSIVAIPPEIGKLSSLKSLDLSFNKLLTVPGELGDCPKLREVHLEENPLSDHHLRRVVVDGVQKSVLTYIRKKCPKSDSSDSNRTLSTSRRHRSVSTSKRKARQSKKSESEDGQMTATKQKSRIAVEPARPEHKIIWSESVSKVRPFIVFCILKDINIDGDAKRLKQLITLQSKFHDEDCKKRTLATVATHDLKKIRFPLTYTAKDPEHITIHALGRVKPVTATELVTKLHAEAEQLRKDKKRKVYSGVHQYLHLLNDLTAYACLLDSENTAISLPPITNCDSTKITESTKDVLIEVSSSKDWDTAKNIMEALLRSIFASPLVEHNQDDEPSSMLRQLTIEQIKVETENGMLKLAYPAKPDLNQFDEETEIIRVHE